MTSHHVVVVVHHVVDVVFESRNVVDVNFVVLDVYVVKLIWRHLTIKNFNKLFFISLTEISLKTLNV